MPSTGSSCVTPVTVSATASPSGSVAPESVSRSNAWVASASALWLGTTVEQAGGASIAIATDADPAASSLRTLTVIVGLPPLV
jgi:hypothetical protein